MEKCNIPVSLSIIVPVYNAGEYLCECIDGLLCTVDEAFNYEVICIDDGSTDNSPEILQQYSEKYPEIVKIVKQNNSGVSVARNIGVLQARGEYVAFADADDVPNINVLKAILLDGKNHKADLISYDYYQGEKYYPNELSLENISFIHRKERIALTCVWRELIKKSILLDNEVRFEPRLSIGEDLWFNEQLVCYINKAIHYPVKGYFYRNHASTWQSNTEASYIKKKMSMIKIAELCSEFLKTNPEIDKDSIKRIKNRQAESTANAIIYSLKIDEDTRELIQVLMQKGLYPFEIRKSFFEKKISLASAISPLLRFRSIVFCLNKVKKVR